MMLLDTGGTVFVWDGPGANHDERRQTYETVMVRTSLSSDYVSAAVRA